MYFSHQNTSKNHKKKSSTNHQSNLDRNPDNEEICLINTLHDRSPQRCSMKKGVLRIFAKFTGKQLCQSLFFNKVAGPRPATLLKKRLWHRCFPVNFTKFLRSSFFTEHLWMTASDMTINKTKNLRAAGQLIISYKNHTF